MTSLPVDREKALTAPLSDLPPEQVERIEALVALPSKPPRWLYFGPPGPKPLAAMESRAWWEWHWQRGMDPDAKRRTLSPALRRAVIERDGLVCGICRSEVLPADVHIDHIHPVARGGTDHLKNLQVTHSLCNIRKGDRI